MPSSIPVGLLETMCGQPLAREGLAECHAGPRAVFGEGDEIGIVIGNSADDADVARTAAVLNVPGKKFHAPLMGRSRNYSTWYAQTQSSDILIAPCRTPRLSYAGRFWPRCFCVWEAPPPPPQAGAGNPAIAPVDRLRESWWAQRHNAVLAQVKANPNIGLVLLGDSITQNYEKAKAPDENFQPAWQRFYGSRTALNAGFSGDRTEHVLWRLEHGEIDGIRPRAVVLLIGTNNTAAGQSARRCGAWD